MPLTKAQIEALQASELNFDDVLYSLSIVEIAKLIGLADYLATGRLTQLPSANENVEVEAISRTAQIFRATFDKLLLIQRSEVASNIAQFSFDDTDIVNGILPFAALSGLSRYPTSAGEFMVFKAGDPIAVGSTTDRSGDATLLPGVGIQFTEAWASGTNGVLWVLTGAANDLASQYTFRASSFTGVGYKTAALGNLGTDIRGNAIQTLPTSVGQLMVWLHGVGLLAEGVSESWVGTLFGTSNPTVTFTFDLLPDQNITFVILR